MADAIEKKNMFLINAPAGSGKTTAIKNKIRDIIYTNKNAKVLCITYTNRATEELQKEGFGRNVEISTIHSFISSFIKIYFAHDSILELYFEVYGDEIQNRINNVENKSKISDSNNKYKEKHDGELSFEIVKRNVTTLYYNELPFNSLYFGGLSHDDLLSFTKIILERFPIIRKRIRDKYKYIFIDEYQDTSSDVLDIFYYALKDSNTQLFLYGDRMQQIYKNYDGEFEEKLDSFDLSQKLSTNYRSSEPIIKVLNKIYNNESYHQEASANNLERSNMPNPKVIICGDLDAQVEIESRNYQDPLTLYIANKQRFEKNGAGELFKTVSRMDQYGFGRKYSAVDVLTKNQKDNPDEIFNLLFFLFEIKKDIKNEKYGLVLQKIKKNKMLNNKEFSIENHSDKEKLLNKLKFLVECLESELNIETVLKNLLDKNILNGNMIENYFSNQDYDNMLKVSIIEIDNLVNYLEDPHTSTQHGVKGESHNTVLFVAEDSGNPSVKMYDFLKLFAHIDINLDDFEKTYFDIYRDFEGMYEILQIKRNSDFVKAVYNEYSEYLEDMLQKMMDKYGSNDYFNNIYKTLFERYFDKPGATRMKDCININKIYGVFVAYKLFYVGCSRAKENLIVFLSEEKISGFKEELIKKFESIGFEFNSEEDKV